MLALPNIFFGLVVLVLFVLGARTVRSLVGRLTRSRSKRENLARLLKGF